MRMKTISEARTLRDAVKEFLSYKKARKVRERTLNDYKKYIDRFVEQSANSMDIDVLKTEILNYFAEIPSTSPARYNHPYQYLHALFEWCAMQDCLPSLVGNNHFSHASDFTLKNFLSDVLVMLDRYNVLLLLVFATSALI